MSEPAPAIDWKAENGKRVNENIELTAKFRADDARDLIRSQQALIRSQCERLHTPPPQD